VISATGNATVGSGDVFTLNLSANEDVTQWTIDWGDGVIETINGPTYTTLEDMHTTFHSAGTISGGEITDGGGGTTFDVAAGTGFIRSSDSRVATLYSFDWLASTGNAIADGQSRFVGVEYNAGTPQVVIKSSDTWNLNDEFPLGSLTRLGTTLHISDNPQAVGDHAAQMLRRAYETRPLARDERNGGLILGETGTRNVTLTAGALWDRLNRAASYVLDLTGKASDPRKKVFSLDGTKSLDDGANEKGAEINLSTANQEDIQSFPESDINGAAALLIQQLQKDSVALRQLGNNLEHRVLPRMRAVARCIEGCLENLVAQYETGAFNPISVSGRRFDNHRFANRVISPEDIAGHDGSVQHLDILTDEEKGRLKIEQEKLDKYVLEYCVHPNGEKKE